MDNIPEKSDVIATICKIAPPFIVSVMAKVAADYKRGKRISFLSTLVITTLAACGAILGYWFTRWMGWTEYKMTMTIFFCGLFADKFFEFLFSKYFITSLLNIVQDSIVDSLSNIIDKIKRKS